MATDAVRAGDHASDSDDFFSFDAPWVAPMAAHASVASLVGPDVEDFLNLDAHDLGGSPSPGQGTSFDDDLAKMPAKAIATVDGPNGIVELAGLNADALPVLRSNPTRTYGVPPTGCNDVEDLRAIPSTSPMPPASPVHQQRRIGGLVGMADAGGIGIATPGYTESEGMMASGGVPHRPSRRGEGNAKRERQAAPDTGADSRPSQRQRTDVGPVEPYVAAEDAGPGRVVCPGCNKKRDVTKMHPHQQSHLPRWQQTNVCDGRCAGAVFVSRCWCDHVCVPQHVKNASSATPRA